MKYYPSNPVKSGTPDSIMVIPITTLFQCAGMPLAQYLQKMFGLPGAFLIGSLCMSLGVFLASKATTLTTFMITYGMMLGLGNGLAYTSPIVAGFKHFPNRKGAVSGMIVGGFGSGGFLFNFIGSKLFNPENLGVDPATGLFPSSVYNNFSTGLKKLSFIYLGMQLAGVLMLKKSMQVLPVAKPQANEGKAAGGKYPTVRSAVLSKPFLVLWSCIALSATAGLNTASLYKMYGSKFEAISADAFLSLVGGLGSLANGLGRTQWGIFLDVYGFKKLFSFLTVLQAATMMLYKYTTGNKALFNAATMVLFLCLGGNFAMAPGVCAKIFGADLGPKVFALLFSAFAAAAIGGARVNKVLMSSGFESIFKVMAASSLAAGFAANVFLESGV